MKRSRRPRGVLAALALVLVAAAACGSSGDDVDSTESSVTTPTTSPATTAPATPSTTGSSTNGSSTTGSSTTVASTAAPSTSVTTTVAPTTTADNAVEQTVNVYWAGTVVDAVGTPERLLAGGRVITTAAPARAAIEAMLDGPNSLESDIGWVSSIPRGTRLLDINISDGLATVDLSSEFEQSSGSLDEMMRIGQVVFTLTQFDSVDAVAFRIDGEPRDVLGSHGIEVAPSVDRSDFEQIRALILPEDPYPGAVLRSGDSISGEANTFEANVQWVVTNSVGLIVGEGFTTATAGNGTWGRFDVEVEFDDDMIGLGALIVFETSARDGSQVNVVEIPVEFVGS